MTSTVPVNLTWLILLVAAGLPVIVDLLVPGRWGQRARTLILLGLSAVVVEIVDTATTEHNDLGSWVGDTVLLFLIAVGLRVGFWQPVGITGRNGHIQRRRRNGNGKNGDNGRTPPA